MDLCGSVWICASYMASHCEPVSCPLISTLSKRCSETHDSRIVRLDVEEKNVLAGEREGGGQRRRVSDALGMDK